MNVKKIRTDNVPMIDEMIYYLKLLCLNSVVKDEDEANAYETVSSLKNGSTYVSSIKGNYSFYSYKYEREDYNAITDENGNKIDPNIITHYLLHPSLVPEEIQRRIGEYKRNKFINEYEEENNYYRMLYGLPDLGEPGLKVPEELHGNISNVDFDKYIHEMSPREQDILYIFGVIDSLKSTYDYPYLDYIGSRRINPFVARTAAKFSLLSINTEAPVEVLNRFKDKYESNRVYTIKCLCIDAFKAESVYFDKFMIVFILIQTMIDILAELPDMVIKRELFDLKTIKLMFESHGIDYFPEIPYKYQIAMLRNLNRLLQYKSTTKNIIDICSLFGFDNIQVFKYYLLKIHKIDPVNGEYIESDDNDTKYDLKFLRVPVDDIPDNHIYNRDNYEAYDEVTLSDQYWDGDKDHLEVMKEILDTEFNYVRSKYLSVDTINDVTEMAFEGIYFYNMILNAYKIDDDNFFNACDELTISIPYLSIQEDFSFIDVIIYLIAITYIYYGFEDNLTDSISKKLYIKGFNFETDMDALLADLNNSHISWDELGLPEFVKPESKVLSYTDLMNIFNSNTKLYSVLIDKMNTADNKYIYDIYKKIYDATMTMELNEKFYISTIGYYPKTYSEYLAARSPILYKSLRDISITEDNNAREELVSNTVQYIVYALENVLKDMDTKYLFNGIPTVSMQAIQKYILKVIDFYKSFKVQMYNINSVYKFDDKLDNKINIIDAMHFDSYYESKDPIQIVDHISTMMDTKFKDKLSIEEYVTIITDRLKELYKSEDLNINDIIKLIDTDTRYSDSFSIRDTIKIIYE